MILSFHLNSIIFSFSTCFIEKEKEKEKIISLLAIVFIALLNVLKECFHASPFHYSSLTNFSTVFTFFYTFFCKKLHSLQLEETRYTSMSNHYDRLFPSRHESRVYKKTGNGRKLFECVARQI